jgi:hypothetical protein
MVTQSDHDRGRRLTPAILRPLHMASCLGLEQLLNHSSVFLEPFLQELELALEMSCIKLLCPCDTHLLHKNVLSHCHTRRAATRLFS